MTQPNKYESVRDQVLDRIAHLEVGDALPPERSLADELGVARMTLRRALEELAREGVLDRHQGRGTFLAQPKISQQLEMTSFSEDMRRRGLVPGSRTLSMQTASAGASLGQRLELSPRASVVRVRRLRTADGEPMAIETLHVPAELVPGLSATDLDGASFYDLLVERYELSIATGHQVIEPTVLNAEEAEHLQAPEHSPAFLFERTSRSSEGRLIEFVRSVYRGDRYRLEVELHPPRRSAAIPSGGRRDERP